MSKPVLLALVLCATPVVARAQASVIQQPLAPRAYRLPGLLDSTMVSTPSADRLRESLDRMQATMAQVAAARRARMATTECPMPVTRVRADSVSQATMDSVAADPPGSAAQMPRAVPACVNPLRR
jgi:hypothetical protein